MAAHINNPSMVLVLNAAEASALASLLYTLQTPEVLDRINVDEGFGLGVNQRVEINELWGPTFGKRSVEI